MTNKYRRRKNQWHQKRWKWNQRKCQAVMVTVSVEEDSMTCRRPGVRAAEVRRHLIPNAAMAKMTEWYETLLSANGIVSPYSVTVKQPARQYNNQQYGSIDKHRGEMANGREEEREAEGGNDVNGGKRRPASVFSSRYLRHGNEEKSSIDIQIHSGAKRVTRG